ncbi:hypothetical protein [Streptomyces similanensis]|uniref:Uncharacterized protein n=1 Tax=Streptomyces similanensis TaxID=1274988 RepID=A0ABP9L3V1_9ACTN
MPKNTDVRAAVETSGLKLDDLVKYDSRTAQLPDGPQTVPGGHGRLRDVWAADGPVVARVEREDGTSAAPLLADLRAVALGCLPESADVPQVKAARRLLTHDGQPLAAFSARHHCISSGAHLDPRRETGEVVLGFRREDRATTVDEAEEERTVNEYADLFGMAGWTVQLFRERDRTGRERLTRLILSPPPVPFPVNSIAVYVPDPDEDYRDLVIIQSQPEGATVEALSARHRKIIRVPVDKLQPRRTEDPLRGEPTDWWRVLDKSGQFIVKVPGETLEKAAAAAVKIPAARQALKRDGKLFYLRFSSWELPDAAL